MKSITVRGARTHNLKNIDLTLPRDKLIVITGLSGSGKSSLAFDTLYAEGQRRYVESLSTYARQFLSVMEKPDVDHIEGLSPAIAIEQKTVSHNPRSTVGTITEIYDYLRLLFARVGQPHCPQHNLILQAQTISQMVDVVLAYPEDTKIMLLAPLVQDKKGSHEKTLENLRSQGFVRARIDGEVIELDQTPLLAKTKKHTIEVVVDRIKVRADLQTRLAESFATALQLTDGLASIIIFSKASDKTTEQIFSAKFACPKCGYSITELEPRIFSFNNPAGACPGCDGLGVEQLFDPDKVIHDASLNLASGALRGWDRHHVYYHQLLTALAKHYDFSLEMPFNQLSKKLQDIILYGSGKEKIIFTFTSHRGRKITKNHKFEGVIPNMSRRYNETESDAVREELAKYLSDQACQQCHGTRLREASRHVFINEVNLPAIAELPIDAAKLFFTKLKLPGQRGEIAAKIIKELIARLTFLVDVGLRYLSLSRNAETLSGGEAQRIRLASQIGSGLVGVMYILDEPSIGLHQRDNKRLLNTLIHLRDMGNTVIVVEHDAEAMLHADHLVDIGPGAGIHGGKIVAAGTPKEIMQCSNSLTGKYLSRKKSIAIPEQRKAFDKKSLIILRGATLNNLDNIKVELPIGLMTCITGVSGSGKSSLINNTLYPVAAKQLNGTINVAAAGPHQALTGLELLDKVIDIDQSPIGRTPRSNPATYTGLFTPIRELFAATREARARGYKPGRFSFNVKGGRCEACQGDGLIKVEMHFLPNVYVTCEVCQGRRYNRETLEILYKGKNIHQVLQMTVEEAGEFYAAVPIIARKCTTMIEVGLSYIHLGQSATTLSGGEAQRIKLSRELSKRDTGKTLYILDEPTTGLHFYDIEQLLKVLHTLRDRGNTVIVIEHNLDVIKTADWIIDLGPEGGDRGGKLIATGTPEQVARNKKSYTGQFLREVISG